MFYLKNKNIRYKFDTTFQQNIFTEDHICVDFTNITISHGQGGLMLIMQPP